MKKINDIDNQSEIKKQENNYSDEKNFQSSVFVEKESKAGPLIGSIIIIIVILVGGLYFLNQQIQSKKIEINQQKNSAIEEINQIKNEIDIDVGLEDINSELDLIDSEFDSI